MFYYLSLLSDWFGPLNVFQYVTFRTVGAALTSFAFCLWIGPHVISALHRLNLGQPLRRKEEVHKLADLHESKQGTPTMGGVLILFSMTLACVLWGRPTNPYLWLALGSTLALGTLGFCDDYAKVRQKSSSGLSGRKKLLAPGVGAGGGAGVIMLMPHAREAALKLQIPFVREEFFLINLPVWGAMIFFVFVIVGSSNAVNLTDGLDGLASGCILTVALVLGLFAYLSSHAKLASYLFLPRVPGGEELVIFCAAIFGACLGFLWFNCHPAQIFMGDTGSLSIGGAVAVVAICINQELLLAIIGGVFVMEALSVILQVISFRLTGRRIFAMSPIHHHFELRGWSETAVVTRFWILSVVFALAGLASLKLR
ncbi:MAG: phospho-N-acetylmuramoyl-pentapeptide-transferase [Verrucomicrobia bacterium]|nr:phospho-N-acetylmuramoyl-pentapeptide-transferase [Verrucomicrobiota bacterium]